MKFYLIQSSVIQGIGLILIFLASVYLGRTGGVILVGEFNEFKTLNDFAVSFFSFGLPQAVALHIAKVGHGSKSALVYSLYYIILIFIIICLMTNIFEFYFDYSYKSRINSTQYFLLSLSAALFTGYSIHRGVILANFSQYTFSMISALPNAALFFFALTFISFDYLTIEFVYPAAGIVCIVTTGILVFKKTKEEKNDLINWRLIWNQSFNTFIQSFLYSSVTVSGLILFKLHGANTEQWGLFSVASLVIILPTTVLALIAPLLFIHWARQFEFKNLPTLKFELGLYAIFVQIVAIALIPLAPFFIRILWGPDFVIAMKGITPLTMAVGAFFFVRLITPALQSLEHHIPLNISCLLRLLGVVGVFEILMFCGFDAVVSLAWAWTMAEYAAAITIAVLTKSSRQH